MSAPATETLFRVVPSVHFTPSRLALARRHRTIEGALAEMGEGMVVTADGKRVVAFHEQHLRWVEHAVETGRLSA